MSASALPQPSAPLAQEALYRLDQAPMPCRGGRTVIVTVRHDDSSLSAIPSPRTVFAPATE